MQIIIITVLVLIILYLLKREFSRDFTEQTFLTIVNHTFRTPLTRIKWMADAIKTDMPRKDELEIITNLDNSVNRLLELVDIVAGIKDIQNTSTYDLKAVSMREILEDALKKYSVLLHDKKISLKVPSLVNLPLLTIDTKKISFVINVIIENAILYAKEGGSIDIEAELKNKELVLKIKDDGIGLSRKDRKNIFKRFYRGERAKKMNTDGMGLGLYASKEIINRHSGQIYAISKGENLGTTFYIVLPRNK
jgi:two-component system sensor histidine kinase VicK